MSNKDIVIQGSDNPAFDPSQDNVECVQTVTLSLDGITGESDTDHLVLKSQLLEEKISGGHKENGTENDYERKQSTASKDSHVTFQIGTKDENENR